MKGKLLVAIATGLLAASMSYAAPAPAADDFGSTLATDSTETPSDNSGMPGQNSEMSNPGGAGASGSMGTPSNNDMNSSSGGSDDMSADTATGDDDY